MTDGGHARNDPKIPEAPAYRADKHALTHRAQYDFSDYGFVINADLGTIFEIVPASVTDDEAFLFFFSIDDIRSGAYSLYNFHAFLKYSGGLEQFARSRGKSVQSVPLVAADAFGQAALTYDRLIIMRDLFEGAESVIDFIGGRPDFLVRDSHTYFTHRHNHYYSGLLHAPGDEARYDALRRSLFESIKLV